jgi:tetratricopeptide (TPR) repeat protein
MRRSFFLSAALLTVVFTSRAEAARDASPKSKPSATAASANDLQRQVAELIEQLGDEQYAVRRRAEEDLARLGPDAFDQLKLAEDHMDLEVAERARYIVQKMRVEWVRPDDSPEVRRTLARYGDLSESDRLKRINRLAELEGGEGLPALSRVARLEPSPRIARRAALAVLKEQSPGGDGKILEACRQELGESDRAPAVWIGLWIGEGEDHKATLADWNQAIDVEAALLRENSQETDFEIVSELMKRQLDACHELGLVNETTASLMRIVDIWGVANNAEQRSAMLAWALRWIIDQQRWDVLEQVEEQRGDELQADRKLLYYLAAAKSRALKADEAAKLSTQAFEMPADDPSERVQTAGSLCELGQIEWAEREYRKALEDLPVISGESLLARRDWATWLHDREQYKKAADVIGEFFEALEEDGPAQRRLMRQIEGRQYLNALNARRHFYLACHYESEKEYDRQREALKKADALYGDDPDILIAMHRSPGADDEFRKETVARIQAMSQRHLMLIEQDPDEPSFHNQWAWLISNTEGDFQKAVEHSKKSLELSPEEPSYLDTLGRCYFSAGEIEEAVKTQRRAVELAPHYQVMRRQLAEFERALAAKRGG